MNTENPQKILVSIICDCYNHEKYIRACLDGFVMQECNFLFEVLVHDDASTDNSASIIKEYEEKYPNIIKPIYQTINQYSSGGNIWGNFQFPRANGKYIAICEGDDYWTDPLKLQKQVVFLEENPDFAIVSSKAQILHEDKLGEIIGDPFNKQDYFFNDFFTRNNLITCTILFLKSNINFESFEKIYFGDWMLYCNILNEHKGKKAKVLNETFAHYRIHSAGAMAKLNHITSIEKHWVQILEINKYFKVSYSRYDKQVIKKYAVELYVHYLKTKATDKAMMIAKQCYKLLRFKAPFRTFLSYYRYRNKLS